MIENFKDSISSSIKPELIDQFGRKINYVRLSVTDRCDLRCVYCMSDNMKFLPRAQLLTIEEISRIGRAFVALGVNKIRITGGEPLTRRNIINVFNSLGKINELDDLTITTNGTLLKKFAQPLKQAGVTRINISLDTLKDDRFRKITRNGNLKKTMEGIDAALKVGFQKVKLNTVIMKDHNDDEIIDLIEFIRQRGMDISFIEEMPMGIMTDGSSRASTFYSSDQVLDKLNHHYEVIESNEKTGGPAKYYRFSDNNSRIGFISPHSHNFCGDCNRVRVTAEGRLLLCLGQEHSIDLRRVVRANPLDDGALHKVLIKSMQLKPKGHDFNVTKKPSIMRYMSSTGG